LGAILWRKACKEGGLRGIHDRLVIAAICSGNFVVDGFSLLFQLTLASFGKLLPGLSHLLQLLAVSGRGGSGHLPAFGGMQKVLVYLFQAEAPRSECIVAPGQTSGK
jgi:hypothetical protein